jgi:hypothetical protein
MIYILITLVLLTLIIIRHYHRKRLIERIEEGLEAQRIFKQALQQRNLANTSCEKYDTPANRSWVIESEANLQQAESLLRATLNQPQ